MPMIPLSFPRTAAPARRFRPLSLAALLLDVVSWCLPVVGAVAVLMTGMLLATGRRAEVQLPVALILHGASAGAASIATGTGTLSIRASAGVAAAVLLVLLAVLALILLVVRQLRALVADIGAGTPFGPDSARRVRLIGAAIVAADAGRALVVLVASLWAGAHVHLPGLAFAVSFPLQVTPLGAGLLLIVLAEVFRRGSALQQDHDLTI
jgi:hypothetical protein